jgi:hypothetical protein
MFCNKSLDLMKKYLALLFFLLSVSYLKAQKDEINPKDTLLENRYEPVSDTIRAGGLFQHDDPLHITLISDFTSFIKPKYDDKYLPATLIVHLPSNDSIVKNIRIKTRGKSRKRMCHFPPIKLNFKTDPIKEPELEGINKVKMVTYCKSNMIYNSYILKEYLVYKLYNAITDYGFKVRLLKVDYEDTGKRGLHQSRYGFVIEPVKALIKRLNAVEIESKVILSNQLDQLAADRVALFNYMIGNTDWQYQTFHNLKFIKILDLNAPGAIPIPYDFDFSGFVGTDYAAPQEWSGVDNIRERDYMGFCRDTPDNFNKLKEEFLAAEQEIYDIINNFEPLAERERKRLYWYIQEFYKDLKYKNSFKIITSTCREPY